MKSEELLYASTHEWAHIIEKGNEKFATIGISAFAIEALTDLVFIQLPEVGQVVSTGSSLGEIESVKAVSDIYSPVDGEIVEVNSPLANSLETFSEDPYGEGWIARIRITDQAGVAQLMDYEAYQKQCAEEG